jgi:hypothetical protein
VIQELKKRGLRDRVKVIIGADAYGIDAAQAVTLVRSLL